MATSNSTVPPFPNEDRGPGLVASVVVFFVITAIVYGFRVWCRLRPKYAMTAADYIITLAMVSYLTQWPASQHRAHSANRS